MEIANPIYDAVFKFLMEDKKSAALIIGAITGFDIEDVELRPTEAVLTVEGVQLWTVYRLDLSARVRTPEGSRLVLVEIQKAKFHSDIERFRRYLGGQYAAKDNFEEVVDPDGVVRRRALPIFTIYILGHRLGSNGDVPVIRVSRGYYDGASGEALSDRDEFIESLTHDSAIIQVPALREHRRNRLERMLAVFDQALIKPGDQHLLKLDDAEYPQECQALLRRLLQAVADNELRQRMVAEDEIVSEFELRERREERMREIAEEERRQKEEALAREAEAHAREAEAHAREAEERRLKEGERRQKEEAFAREAEERRQKEAALAEIEELKRQLGKK